MRPVGSIKTPGSGRKKGSLNKATLERRAKAQLELLAAARENPPRERALDRLARLQRLIEGAAAVSRPTTQRDVAGGQEPNPDGNWDRFTGLLRLWAQIDIACANYEAPKLQAIAIAPPPQEQRQARIIDLKVFEGGRQVTPAIPAPAARKESA